MASILCRSGTYYGQWYDAKRSPKTKRLSFKTRSRRAATRLIHKLEEAYAAGAWDPWVGDIGGYFERPQAPPTAERAVSMFLAFKEAEGLSPETLKKYRSTLRAFERSVAGTKALAAVAPEQVDAFVKRKGLSRGTQRLHYRIVRAFMNWAVEEGQLAESPVGRVRPPKPEQALPRFITHEQLSALCRALEAHSRERRAAGAHGGHCGDGDLVWCVPLFWFAFYTGLRVSELARLRWEHVDFENELVYVLQQKSGRQGTIPLNSRARGVLDGVEHGQPETYVFGSPRGDRYERSTAAFRGRVQAIFKRYRVRAGLPDAITFHSLRHGFCTALAMAGTSAPVIMAAARHAHIQTSMRYVHLASHQLKGQLEAAFAKLPERD